MGLPRASRPLPLSFGFACCGSQCLDVHASCLQHARTWWHPEAARNDHNFLESLRQLIMPFLLEPVNSPRISLLADITRLRSSY